MTLTDEQLAEIRGRLEAAESSRISAPSVGTDYSPRQARDDIRALLDEVERLEQANGELCDFAQRPAEKMLARSNAEIERLRALELERSDALTRIAELGQEIDAHD